MKIAVVGAGIFGCTVAIELAQQGVSVDLFEKNDDIMQAASGINQYRLHRGYHYPRSIKTALSSKESEQSFIQKYGSVVLDDSVHYYCVAKEKSKVSSSEFLKFCDAVDLEYTVTSCDCVNNKKLDLVVKVKESLINHIELKNIVNKKIDDLKINLICNHVFSSNEIDKYALIVNCSYANLNGLIDHIPETQKDYQFELCEKPILKLPEIFRKKSIVIIDGPFCCIDPYADTDLHVMGNVVHAIHASNTGKKPIIPDEFADVLNKGVVSNPSITNVSKFIESAKEFMPGIEDAAHIGSMYTIRTVLPYVDATDERPTLVTKIHPKIINVFSGKIGNCVEAAKEVWRIISEEI